MRLCREHVTFIALCGDTAPHFTTLAAFVSGLGTEAARLFAQVLYLCDRQGLIGREMFAIDGVKLPSNTSKARSGTRADFQHQAGKLEAAAQQMLARHRERDGPATEPDLAEKSRQRIERLQREAGQLRNWLAAHPADRKGSKGATRKSNRTDPDSAKMATGKGVIQGYTGVAAVDTRHQIIIEAQAHGTGSEQELLLPVIHATRSQARADTLYTADAGYHSAANLAALEAVSIPALIADNGMRQRDERFKDQGKHLSKTLYRNGSNCRHNGYLAAKYTGTQCDCQPCDQRAQCLRTPDKTKVRQVAFFRGKSEETPENACDRMKRAIDSEAGRVRYGQRFATVEPVFGNVRHNKRLNRFTLRGQAKVDGQWKLYCLVHNIEKLAHYGLWR